MIGPGKIGNILPAIPKRTNNDAVKIKIKSMSIFLFDVSYAILLRSFKQKRSLDLKNIKDGCDLFVNLIDFKKECLIFLLSIIIFLLLKMTILRNLMIEFI